MRAKWGWHYTRRGARDDAVQSGQHVEALICRLTMRDAGQLFPMTFVSPFRARKH
jgi:hypothetical protein